MHRTTTAGKYFDRATSLDTALRCMCSDCRSDEAVEDLGEASGDKTGPESLVGAVQQTLAWLEGSLNNLRYPTSRFDNIRTGRF